MNKILEIACFNKTSALIAQKAGANRIELSVDYKVGGVSPSEILIKNVLNEIKLPVHVLIRPRSGSFNYTPQEFALMIKQIEFCKTNQVQGVVFGILDEDKNINIDACKELIKLSSPMITCFHRAIDECEDKEKALEQIVELGFNAVLTSGGKKSASEGLLNLKAWQNIFGVKISIIAGGGVRSSNLSRILDSGCHVYHSSCITNDSEVASEQEITQMKAIINP